MVSPGRILWTISSTCTLWYIGCIVAILWNQWHETTGHTRSQSMWRLCVKDLGDKLLVGGKTCYYISNVVLLLSRLICCYGVAFINFHNLFSEMKKKIFFSNPKSVNLVSDGSYIKTKHACNAFVRPFQINSLVCTKIIILKLG